LWAGSAYGLVGIALAHLGVGFLRTFLRLWMASRLIFVSWFDVFLQLKPSFISGFALVLLAVPVLNLTSNWAPLLSLIATAVAGAVGYLSVLWLLERDQLIEAARLVLKR
jgi:hypothetical protein